MTTTYRATGRLTHPVSDLAAARRFLRCEETGMTVHIWQDRRDGVHRVSWDLLDEQTWEVTLVADRDLPDEQLRLLSEWISGQNSDGLGEGFEQQPFAEHGSPDDWYGEDGEIEDMQMSSFDWETNPCELARVEP
jgi:hypothetical protein